MKKVLIAFALFLSSFSAQAQSGYEITIDLKNCNTLLQILKTAALFLMVRQNFPKVFTRW
jgi:hypothetical protein